MRLVPPRSRAARHPSDILRLYPQAEGMAEMVAHYHLARRSPVAPPRIGTRNGYWHGEPGMRVPETT
jgi:O2-independent ubiquinone biosynthesis protein UbiV